MTEQEQDVMIVEQDLDWWLETAPSLNWRYARTMPQYPHSYVVRDKTFDDPDFLRAVKVIRTFGKPEKFNKCTRIYLTAPDGSAKWWTMGDTLEGTTIINQDTTGNVYGVQDAPTTESDTFVIYDSLSTEYDDRYKHYEDLLENKQVQRLIRKQAGTPTPSILDIGAGTGLAMDLKLTTPKKYRAVDPSQGMLNELVRKHPQVTDIWPMTAESYLEEESSGKRYDMVLALFGVASYLTPDSVRRLLGRASKGLVFMSYEDGYLPDYYHGVKPDTYDASREALFDVVLNAEEFGVRAVRTKIGHFDTVVVKVGRRG